MLSLVTSARRLRQTNESLGLHGSCDGAAVVKRNGCEVRVNHARSTAEALHKAANEHLCRSCWCDCYS